MKHNTTRLLHLNKHELDELHLLSHRSAAQEFESVEDLIRQDAAQVEPPDSIIERLNESIANEQRNSQPWWRKLFSR